MVHRDRRHLEPLDPEEHGTLKHIKQYNPTNAVRAIRNIFKLAAAQLAASSAIYYYNWYAPSRRSRAGTPALFSSNGKPRPVFSTFKAQMRKYAR